MSYVQKNILCRFYVQGIQHKGRSSPSASSLSLSFPFPFPLSLSVFASVSQSGINASGNDAPSHCATVPHPLAMPTPTRRLLHVACCVLCVACTHPERHWHWTSPDTIRSRPKCEKAVETVETASIKVNVSHWLRCECYECYECCECCEYFMSIANV